MYTTFHLQLMLFLELVHYITCIIPTFSKYAN